MGKIVNESQRSLNIECDSSEEASKLKNYLEIILNYIKGDM